MMHILVYCHMGSLLPSKPSRSAWQSSFQRNSQSNTALHDFNVKYEVQPPGRHGRWFRMLFSFTLRHS